MLEHGARHATAMTMGAAAAFVMSACDAQIDDPAAPAPAVTSAAPAAETPDPSPAQTLDPPLRTVSTDDVLLPPMSGTGSAETPSFTIDREKFTVRIACAGNGELQLFRGTEKIDVPCDGTTRRIHVATDAERDRVPIKASRTQRWSVSVVVTDDFSRSGSASVPEQGWS